MGYLRIHEVEKNSCVLIMGVRRNRRKFWLGLWNEIFNEYKSIVLIEILTLIKKMKMIYLRDFGVPESPRSRKEQLCVNYGYEKRHKKIMARVME